MKMRLQLVSLILILSASIGSELGSARSEQISAGGFSFSDELGGFHLVSVSGDGTITKPFVIVEKLLDIFPAILVIRRQDVSIDQKHRPPVAKSGIIYIEKNILNLSNKVWRGFDLELRQDLNKPSSFSDGLSFDQIMRRSSDITADKFAKHYRLFEPRDKICFEQGNVDPGKRLRLTLPISDTTPVPKFYLSQAPRFRVTFNPALCGNSTFISLESVIFKWRQFDG